MRLLMPILLSIAFPVFIYAGVHINEFSPDLSPQTVELYNSATESADISGWYVDDDGSAGYYTVPPDTILYPYSCLVISSNFNLNKSTPDTLRLFGPAAPPSSTSAILVDSYAYTKSPGADKSFARSPDGSGDWSVAPPTFGLSNVEGKSCVVEPTATPTPYPSSLPTSAPTDVPAPQAEESKSYDNIFISEIMAYPEAGKREWVELYNNNDFAVDLTDWFLDDAENKGSVPKKFSASVNAYNYTLIELSSSMFNNDGDEVRLLDRSGSVKDALEYGEVSRAMTLSRTSWNGDTLCETIPSAREANHECASPVSSLSSSSSRSSPPASSAGIRPRAQSNSQSSSILNSRVVPLDTAHVLGAETAFQSEPAPSPSNHIKHLSFLSASYSILTIISVLVKIRNGS